MARQVALIDLRTRARQLSGTVNDVDVTDVSLTTLANQHIPEVYDRLVDADAGAADYFASTAPLTVSAGLAQYALPSDFRNLLNVFVLEDSDTRRPLYPMPAKGRGLYKAPSASSNLEIEYVPTPPILQNDGDTFNDVSGFSELVANLMARDVMIQREDDPSAVMSSIAELKARITSRARSRDRNGKYITDMDQMVYRDPWSYTASSRLLCYRLRAENLELYESLYTYP